MFATLVRNFRRIRLEVTPSESGDSGHESLCFLCQERKSRHCGHLFKMEEMTRGLNWVRAECGTSITHLLKPGKLASKCEGLYLPLVAFALKCSVFDGVIECLYQLMIKGQPPEKLDHDGFERITISYDVLFLIYSLNKDKALVLL